VGIFLVIGFVVGGAVFLVGGLTTLAILLTGLGRLLRGQFALAGRELLLFSACAAMLVGCSLLVQTQPVEFPWHPLHIPIYALALAAFLWCRRLQVQWETAANGNGKSPDREEGGVDA
jgi:hypothetical protein